MRGDGREPLWRNSRIDGRSELLVAKRSGRFLLWLSDCEDDRDVEGGRSLNRTELYPVVNVRC